jgi:hypothetical protein
MFVKQPPLLAMAWHLIAGGSEFAPGLMTLSFSIRLAVPSDIPAINPLFEILDEHHRVALPEVFREPTGARREPSWLDWVIAGPDGAILVAERTDANIRGLVVLVARLVPASVVRDVRRLVKIRELAVSTTARRVGNPANILPLKSAEIPIYFLDRQPLSFTSAVAAYDLASSYAVVARRPLGQPWRAHSRADHACRSASGALGPLVIPLCALDASLLCGLAVSGCACVVAAMNAINASRTARCLWSLVPRRADNRAKGADAEVASSLLSIRRVLAKLDS